MNKTTSINYTRYQNPSFIKGTGSAAKSNKS